MLVPIGNISLRYSSTCRINWEQRHPVKFLAGKCNLKQGNSPVNLVHLEDCIQAITALLMNPDGLRTYHLCAPIHPTRAEYYTKAAVFYDLSIPQFDCSDSDLKRIIMADKICRDLGFALSLSKSR